VAQEANVYAVRGNGCGVADEEWFEEPHELLFELAKLGQCHDKPRVQHAGGARPFQRQTRYVLGYRASGQVGALEEHHGKCPLWGDSTTPSREMKKYDLIFRTSCLRYSIVRSLTPVSSIRSRRP